MSKRLLAVLFIIGLSLLFFHQMTFTDKILARGDTYNYFYPYWDVRNEAYRAGKLPLWTPDIFMGVPLLANPQLGTYYPPNWLTAPFRAPIAIKISILLHIILAGCGMFFLYRTVISYRLLPAITAGIIFAFGGYVGSHVEQINQLQGLAWMPILFLLYHRLLTDDHPIRYGLLLAIAWSMQIFSGHTQTVFMTGVGLSLYGVFVGWAQWRINRSILAVIRPVFFLGVFALIAVMLAIPQLLPSLELTGMSNRGGGFNVQQATAFSLSPNTIGRAILPSYDSQLFGEYVTYIGIIGLGLALWGMVAPPPQMPSYGTRFSLPPVYQKWGWILLAVVGLLLAFGRFNPLYLILAELPGFNLFRVPARWLSLFTLGMAILTGLGVQALNPGGFPSLLSGSTRRMRFFTMFVLIFIGLLIVLTRFVLQVDPRDVYGDPIPQNSTVLIWVISLVVLLILLSVRHKLLNMVAFISIIVELFLASLVLPYNDLTPPEVYLGQRFTISQMLANQADDIAPSRMLSISRLYFDPGDISALRERYNRLGLDEQSQFHAFDAVKKQEMLMPNLPLTWGIASIDGFGGGILPTIYYSQFTSLLLPENELRTVDGRLGEIMAKPDCRGACIPPLNALALADVGYLITDKVYDIWHDDITYDTALAEYWETSTTLSRPEFDFNEVRILHDAPIDNDNSQTIPDDLFVTITDWESLTSILEKDGSTILAVTLVDNRVENVFWQLQPAPFQRTLSSDIKLYEWQSPQNTRALIAGDVQILPDHWQGHEDALPIIRDGASHVIHGDAEPRSNNGTWHVDIVDYSDTRLVMTVSTDNDAYLILKDAYYPGWKATVDNTEVPLYRADTMFRGVPVPAGEHTVTLTFEPDLWRIASFIGVGFWLVIVMGLLLLSRKK